MQDGHERLSIKNWSEDDKPREKLISKGKHALSDAELIAILLGSGNRTESAVQLAQRILKHANNNLADLSKMPLKELQQFKGIGEAKAITIIAATELGKRQSVQEVTTKQKIGSSKDAAQIFCSLLGDLPHEEFWIILLNRANKIISKQLISRGGITGTVADQRIIFKLAIENLAVGIILCHNHPSGNLTPSPEDKQLTQNIKTSAKLLDVTILDHLIVTDNGYYSFADEGLI